MKKLYYLLFALIISSTAVAQSTSVCNQIATWQNAQGIPVTNTPAKYIVKLNIITALYQKFDLGLQDQILYGSQNGNIVPSAQCQKLDNLLASPYPVMMTVHYVYKIPHSNITIQQPVLLISHH